LPDHRLLASLAAGCAAWAAAWAALADPLRGATPLKPLRNVQTPAQPTPGAGSAAEKPAAAPAAQGLRRFYGPPKPTPPPRFQMPLQAMPVQHAPYVQPPAQPAAAAAAAAKASPGTGGKDADPPI
jgi:hypothetical protein